MNGKSTHTYTAAVTEEMQVVANSFLERFPKGGQFAVYGEMGAGKTTFIQGICKALNLHFAGSPTFSLVNEYTLADGRKLFHFDLYRISRAEELMDIGFDEYLETGAFVFIEWPQIASHYTDGMNTIIIRDEGGVREIVF